ncbi:hypothetical protein PO909_014566 [Leuciscus waleckii]
MRRFMQTFVLAPEVCVCVSEGELSNRGRPMRRFMQTFVLAPEGSAVNKFYVHNDIFRYEEEVFGDSEAELGESEEEEEEEEEQVETHASPEPVQDRPSSPSYYKPPTPVSNGVEEQQEEAEPEAEPESQPEPLANQETEAELIPEAELHTSEAEPEEKVQEERGSTPVPALTPPPHTPEPPKAFSWALVTSKNLPPAGAGISSHVLKASVQPRVELKHDSQREPRDQRRERGFPPRGPRADGSGSEGGKPYISFRGRGDSDGDSEGRRSVRYPDSHQLFVGNLPHDIDEVELKEFFMTFGNVVEMRINTKAVGGKLPNFGFVVYDDSEPVQRILGAKPVMFRGEVRLNVEEKKTRAVRERETRGPPDGRRPRGIMGNGRGPARGAMGRGDSRYTPRR